MEGLPLQPLGVEGLPLGWRVCHWGGGFAIGVEGLTLEPLGLDSLPLGLMGLPVG